VSWSSSKTYEFQFRRTALHQLSIPLIFNGAWFSSLTAQASEDKASADGVWGACYAGIGHPPSSMLAFFEASVSYQSVTNWASWNVNTSSGFIGNVFLSVVEKDSNDSIVTVKNLGLLAWVISDSANNGSLKYVTFLGADISNFKIYITYILSDVLGKINYGDAIVTPKSLESVIEIPNYPYKDPKNYLTLVVGAISGSGSVKTYGTASAIQSGTGSNEVYLSFANSAQINGQSAKVKIDVVVTNTSTLQNNDLIVQAETKYKSEITARLFAITFPPNASSIIYDPTMGTGTPPAAEDSNKPIIILLVLVGFSVLAITIVVLIIIFTRKRKEYQVL
jgi:hypothetical protein